MDVPSSQSEQKLRLADLWNVAGILTLARLPFAVLFPFVVEQGMVAVAVYVIGVGTDVVDGVVARRTGTTTLTGALADGVADKTFHLVVAFSMVAVDIIPAWWVLLWFSRELGQLALLLWLITRGRLQPQRDRAAVALGKAVTVILSIAIVSALVGAPVLALAASVLCGILGLTSALEYARLELVEE